jgi:hypothetical protein
VVFPYNRVAIRIHADGAEQQALLASTLAAPEGLEQDVRELLTELDCTAPVGLQVGTEVVEGPGIDRFTVGFSSEESVVVEAAEPSVPKTRPQAKLTVLRGEAEPRELAIESNRVNIGRTKEVAGKEGLRRRNDLAFVDSENTVSREHASIRYDAASGKFRLYDSGSQRGTLVFRDGRRLDVPKGPHGLQLQSGDEIHFGQARVGFEVL